MLSAQPTKSASLAGLFSVVLDWISSDPEKTSAICNVLMLLVTIISVYYAYRAYQHQKKRSQKEAACNLAKYYAKEIIRKYSDITYVYTKSGIADAIKKTLDLRELNNFDRAEIQKLLEAKDCTMAFFVSKIKNIDPAIILDARIVAASTPEERETYRKLRTKDANGNLQIVNKDFLYEGFRREIRDLLNELEWFAMNCQYCLADEELLYQSLHQSFISTVWLLYLDISFYNENNEDKYFTNLIGLFCNWRNRLLKTVGKAEKKRQKFLNKANDVKATVHRGRILK